VADIKSESPAGLRRNSQRRPQHAPGPRAHDGVIVTETPNTMWGTDLTAIWTGEGPAPVFVAIDHCTAECVGLHAAARATRLEALEL
jgi:putative transposase